MMKKRIVCALVTVFLACLFAEENSTPAAKSATSAAVAHRRTAIRYLQLAKQYATEKQWSNARTQAELGLSYDESIADLWHIAAVSQYMQGEAKANVLPLVEKSLTGAEWVDYNRDNARILYADMLCDTNQAQKALSVLDENPFLYSADAEYIRAKAFYNFQTAEYAQKAREKLEAARRIYPHDVRFAKLFFVREYNLNKSALYDAAAPLPPFVKKLADAFILQLPQYAAIDSELELYAAIFADEQRKSKLLMSFEKRKLKAPLYAETALRAGLISESDAVKAFVSLADVAFDRVLLEDLVALLTEEKAKKALSEFLHAYSGAVFYDTDGDLIPNLTVSYEQGLPARISYDKNQDGAEEWFSDCASGVPQQLTIGSLHLQYESWPSWPWLQKAIYVDKNGETLLDFALISETLSWSPFELHALSAVQASVNYDFLFPELADVDALTQEMLLKAAFSYEIPAVERIGAKIRVHVLDGKPQLARYSTAQDVLYAQTQFSAGLPVVRLVDVDGDGLFETTESYAVAKAESPVTVAAEMQSILAVVAADETKSLPRCYISMIQIDQNGDTIPDFSEEYYADGSTISSWDSDGNGLWDIRSVRYQPDAAGDVREEAQFHQPFTDSVITVGFKNGTPVSVTAGDRELSVKEFDGVYWLGTVGTQEMSECIVTAIKQIESQGVSIIVKSERERMLAVRVGNMIFGERLPPSAVKDDEKTNAKSAR